VCLPRQVFFQHSGWDEGFLFGLEDFDLSMRVSRTHRVVYLPGPDILHFGRMSSRKNTGFAYTGVECGYARYLRKHVLGPLGTFGYKLLVTLNLPLVLLAQLLRAGWRRLRHGRAAPDWPHSELGAVWYFTTRGLRRFWRADRQISVTHERGAVSG
jgi:GT2 family glycosyltransferase